MESPNEAPLGYWCALVGQQYLQAMRKQLAHLEMDRWYFTLVHLAAAKEPVTQQELADQLHLDKATMVRAIDHLSAKGYVERQQCPNDRRKHHLVVLPKARAAVKEIQKIYGQLNDLAFAGTSEALRQRLMDQLPRILARLAQADTGLKSAPTQKHE